MVKQVLTFAVLAGFFLTSCNDTKKIQDNEDETIVTQQEAGSKDDLLIGSWVEPNPINDKEVQGIEITEGGNAKSINMATLLYSKWWTKDDQLFLVEESLGNGVSNSDTITYQIVKVDQDSLILQNKAQTIRYKKQ